MALGCTVRELLARIDSRELTEWMAYYQIEPFGPERDDLNAGIIASTIANVNRGKKRKPYRPDDFVPRYDRAWQRQREPAWERMLKTVEALNKAMGGKDLRKQ